MKLIALLLLLPLTSAALDEQRLADAIRKAEGTWTYGIRNVQDEPEARRRCLELVHPIIEGWEAAGARNDPFALLASWYCPVNAQVWARNVRWFYNHPSK